MHRAIALNASTFYRRFEADIRAGRKTITIRDKLESHFKVWRYFICWTV
jgi:UPF0267 protein NTHI1757